MANPDLTNAKTILLKDMSGNPCIPFTNKQDPLTAGESISISDENVISVTPMVTFREWEEA